MVAGTVLLVLTGVGVLFPVDSRIPPATVGPDAAAARAVREVPSLGLVWGKLRGWKRAGAGWELVWQPGHGTWLVRAWVGDEGGEVLWRLEAAPWLPGPRLSGPAAAWVADTPAVWAIPRERAVRRDWQVGEQRVVGALAGGGVVPRPPETARQRIWEAVLVGLLLAGALARLFIPPFRVAPWRQRVLVGLLLLMAAAPWAHPLAVGFVQVGVRPWVARLSLLGSLAVLVATVALGAWRFPASGGRPPAVVPLLAFPVGVLLGRLEPLAGLAEVAAVPSRWLLWSGLLVVASWLVGLAGEGLRELLAPSGPARKMLLVAVAAAVVAAAGSLRGPLVAAILAGSVQRGQGTWVAVAAVWGWFAGLLLAVSVYAPVLWEALLFVVLGVGTVLLLHATGTPASPVADL